VKNDLDKLILGFCIGGLIGGSIFYLLRANKKEKKLFFNKIGTIVAEVGELLKEASVEDKRTAVEEIMKNVPAKGGIADLLALTAMGVNLWKKWR
jgi:hypothetical protein